MFDFLKMEPGKKVAAFLAIILAFGSITSGIIHASYTEIKPQTMPLSEFYLPDVEAINNIIMHNGLAATPTDLSWNYGDFYLPPEWDEFVTWSDDLPRRVEHLTIDNQNLHGHLDISGLTSLRSLVASNNNLTSINTGAPGELWYFVVLDVAQNQLTALDVSGLVNLVQLYVQDNKLTSLEFGENTNLFDVIAYNNKLTSIDVSNLPYLWLLHVYGNYLTTLDVTGLDNLVMIIANMNDMQSESDVIGLNPAQTHLHFHPQRTQPTQPPDDEVEDEFYEGDIAVINAIITNNGLSANLDSPQEWSSFAVFNNQTPRRVAFLDLRNRNLHGSLNLSNLTYLANVNISNNQISALDINGATRLTTLNARGNRLTSLEIGNLRQLTMLDVGENNLTAFDASGLFSLMNLFIHGNQLTSLDVSGLSTLVGLNVYDNQLASLTLGNLAQLLIVFASNNYLTSLDVSDLTSLSALIVDMNNMPSEAAVIGLSNPPTTEFIFHPQREIAPPPPPVPPTTPPQTPVPPPQPGDDNDNGDGFYEEDYQYITPPTTQPTTPPSGAGITVGTYVRKEELLELLGQDSKIEITARLVEDEESDALMLVEVVVVVGDTAVDKLPAYLEISVPLEIPEDGGDFVPHRVIAIDFNGNIIGGSFDEKTGNFTFYTNQTGVHTIAYVSTLQRLTLDLSSFSIIDLAKNTPEITMDVAPMVQDDVVFVPLRFLAEALGATIEWTPETATQPLTIAVAFGDKSIAFGIDEPSYHLAAMGLNAQPKLVENRTMMPLNFFSTFFEAIATWNDDENTIEILKW